MLESIIRAIKSARIVFLLDICDFKVIWITQMQMWQILSRVIEFLDPEILNGCSLVV